MQKIIPSTAILIPDSATKVFAGQLFDTYQWSQEMFDGSTRTFEMVKRPDTVQALCVVDGKVLLLRDRQPHLGERVTFPGGRVEPSDDTILGAIQREVREETGYEFVHWRLISVAQPNNKVEWFIYTFVAWDTASTIVANPGPGEKIAPSTVHLSALRQYVDDDIVRFPEGRLLLQNVHSVEELPQLPEFFGPHVDR